jgi:hypothetical protein
MLVIEFADAALAIAPAKDNSESAVTKRNGTRGHHVHFQPARRFDSLEKYVRVSLRRKGMDLNGRFDLPGVEWIKIWKLLERVLTVSVRIKLSAHGDRFRRLEQLESILS